MQKCAPLIILLLIVAAFSIYCAVKCNKKDDKKTNVTMRSGRVVSPYSTRPMNSGSDCPGCKETGGTKYTRREGFLDQYSMNIPTGSGNVSAGTEPVSSPFYGTSAPIDGGVWQGVNE